VVSCDVTGDRNFFNVKKAVMLRFSDWTWMSAVNSDGPTGFYRLSSNAAEEHRKERGGE
jgi:hypothetical protein